MLSVSGQRVLWSRLLPAAVVWGLGDNTLTTAVLCCHKNQQCINDNCRDNSSEQFTNQSTQKWRSKNWLTDIMSIIYFSLSRLKISHTYQPAAEVTNCHSMLLLMSFKNQFVLHCSQFLVMMSVVPLKTSHYVKCSYLQNPTTNSICPSPPFLKTCLFASV